jgi:hypothetical protein
MDVIGLAAIALGIELVGGGDVTSEDCTRSFIVKQLRGTCWSNASMNSFILVPAIRNIILNTWMTRQIERNRTLNEDSFSKITYEQDTSFDKFIHDFLYMKKPLTKEIMNSVALNIQRNWLYKNTAEQLAGPRDESSGGFPSLAVRNLILTMFNSNDYEYVEWILNREFTSNNMETLIAAKTTKSMPPKLFFMFSGNIPRNGVQEKLNNNKYRLVSATLQLYINNPDKGLYKGSSGGHGIACYMCGNVPYVFDSNCDAPIECAWHQNDFQNYLEYIGINDNQFIDIQNFTSLLYLADDDTIVFKQSLFQRVSDSRYVWMPCDITGLTATLDVNNKDKSFVLQVKDLSNLNKCSGLNCVQIPHLETTTKVFYPIFTQTASEGKNGEILFSNETEYRSDDNFSMVLEALEKKNNVFVNFEDNKLSIGIPFNGDIRFASYYYES